MTNKCPRLLMVVAAFALACGDTTGPPSIARDLDIVLPQLEGARELRFTTAARDLERPPGISAILIPDSEPSGGLPPEWQQGPTLIRYWTAAGFATQAAWGQGFMHYFASHAIQTVRLTLRFNNSTVTTTSGTSEASSFIPWWRDLWTDASVQLGKSCGHVVDASTQHQAWHQPPTPIGGLAKWGTEQAPSFKSAAQPACPREIARDTVAKTEPAPGGGSSGPTGGSGWYTCYYYHEYYTDTGEVIYSAFLGCAGNGGE